MAEKDLGALILVGGEPGSMGAIRYIHQRPPMGRRWLRGAGHRRSVPLG